ncbi:MAG: efflux RND transporter periplasmic adaptor subunit [Cyanobacteria bacterium]|nr:efflux RND transporter periplasmic adaptor subunit [Cyanobacteriota bacterium]
MADIDDLSALKIEREPLNVGGGRWVRWVVLLVFLAGAGGGAYYWLTRERPIEVEVAEVSERAAGRQASVLDGNGYVVARRKATVSSKVTGKVIEVNVEEGMEVREGQVLARLDDSTLQAALRLYRAQLEAAKRQIPESDVRLAQARVQLTRQERLRKEGLNTPNDIDNAKAEVDSLVARIASLQEQVKVAESQIAMQLTAIADTVIRAPFTGVALSKDAQPGEMVSPVSAGGGFTRTGISTIVDMRSLEIEVDVNEAYINRVRPNQPVVATLNGYPGWEIPASVIAVVPTADRQKATVLVRIAFNPSTSSGLPRAESRGKQLDPRILPDMGAKVTFLREADTTAAAASSAAAQTVTLVPQGAVKTDSGTTFVFLVTGATVERRAVKTGGTDGDRVEVLAGLKGGDRVVIAPPPELAAGKEIIVK